MNANNDGISLNMYVSFFHVQNMTLENRAGETDF